jgi:Domain of unknown function (DUF1707)
MCNTGRHRYETRFETTVQDERTDVRASDAERDVVVESLRGHAQAGRLTSDELEERVALALAAKTRDDLAALQRDLPAPARRVATRPRPQQAQHRGRPPFVPIAFLLIAIWAVTGAGYFWPIWPLLWFGFIAMMRSGNPRVTGNTRRTW